MFSSMENQEIRDRWYTFANGTFVKWRGPTRKTLSDFARFLGLPRSVVSQSLNKNGKLPRDISTITAWVNKFGDEVYDVLGMPRPDSEAAFSSLPPELQSAAREIRETLARYNVSSDSAEAESLRAEIMKKHGFAKISTEKP